jgi:hypothetical protein
LYNLDRVRTKDPVLLQKETNYKVYPNPASIELVIKAINNIESEIIEIEFVNETGKLIFTSNFKLFNKEIRIDLSNKAIPPGFYILKINHDNKIERVKVVILS